MDTARLDTDTCFENLVRFSGKIKIFKVQVPIVNALSLW